MKVPKSLTFMSAVLLLAFVFSADAWGQKNRSTTGISAGGVFSPRHSGAGVSVFLSDGSFRDFSIYVDYSDILDRKAVNPGFRFSYYHNLPIYASDWNGFEYHIYGGPGVVLGYMHDRCETNYGFVTGISGCAGIMFAMWHSVDIGMEFQLDAAMKFGMNSNVSFFRAGAVFSYIPMVKIHYAF